MVDGGLLEVGSTLTTSEGLTTASAVVTDDYGILVGGVRYESPDIAAEAVREGRASDGWTYWPSVSTNQTLRDLLAKI